MTDSGCGRYCPPEVLGWAPVPRASTPCTPPETCLTVPTTREQAGWVRAVATSADQAQLGGIFRTHRRGVGHEPAGGCQQPVAQGFGFGAGEITVEGEVPQPAGEAGRQSGELQPAGVAVPVLGRQVAGAERLQLFDLVLDVG